MKNIKKILLIALIDAIASQFYMGYMVEGFRITLSVILFPVLLYLYDEINPIKISIITGLIGIFSRTLIMFVETNNLFYSIENSYQEIGFYIIYGLLYYFLYYNKENKSLVRWFVIIWLCDFISNFGEILVRTSFNIDRNILVILRALIGIAFLRAITALIIIYFMKKYKLLIIKEEHEERYRRLVSLTEELNSETYFMKKNLDYLEKVMINAYTLYENIPKNVEHRDFKNMSLIISKDVHEIKKEYLRVITGIEEITNSTIKYSDMNLKDILIILKESTNRYLKSQKLDIDITIEYKTNFRVKNHYGLMSILRNLLNNSIEALSDKNNKKTIKLYHFEEKNDHIFEIIDNGCGIKKSNIDYIFKPGFSTKFSKETGDVKRGIGLTLVKSIVENDLRGNIKVDSTYNKGTVFKITIPKSILEDI